MKRLCSPAQIALYALAAGAALLSACNPVEKPSGEAGQQERAPATSEAPATPPATEPSAGEGVNLESLSATYEEAKAAFAQSSGEEAKSAYVAATVRYATAVMTSELPPREKYPKALALYEEALKHDPNNAEAKTNRQLILDIYKSMGREPPKSKEE